MQTSILNFWNALKLKPEVTIGDLATALLALVTFGAFFLAWYQLRGLTRQTRATVLLALDERWEGTDLRSVRDDFSTFSDRVEGEAKRQSTPKRVVTAEELFPAQLEAMRTGEREKYQNIFRMCGFFETIAYAARARYIRVSDLDNLFGGSIRNSGKVFREHILDKQRELGEPRYYEYYVWLVDECRKGDTPVC